MIITELHQTEIPNTVLLVTWLLWENYLTQNKFLALKVYKRNLLFMHVHQNLLFTLKKLGKSLPSFLRPLSHCFLNLQVLGRSGYGAESLCCSLQVSLSQDQNKHCPGSEQYSSVHADSTGACYSLVTVFDQHNFNFFSILLIFPKI